MGPEEKHDFKPFPIIKKKSCRSLLSSNREEEYNRSDNRGLKSSKFGSTIHPG